MHPTCNNLRQNCASWNGRQCLNRNPQGEEHCHCARGDARNVRTPLHDDTEPSNTWGAARRPRNPCKGWGG